MNFTLVYKVWNKSQAPCHSATTSVLMMGQSRFSSVMMSVLLLLILAVYRGFSATLPEQKSGSCRNHDGSPICCTGRTNCAGNTRVVQVSYSYTNQGYRYASPSHLRGQTAKCFCDEYCVRSNDCCWDYREVCMKPSKSLNHLSIIFGNYSFLA